MRIYIYLLKNASDEMHGVGYAPGLSAKGLRIQKNLVSWQTQSGREDRPGNSYKMTVINAN